MSPSCATWLRLRSLAALSLGMVLCAASSVHAQDNYESLNDDSRENTLNRLTVGAPFQNHTFGPPGFQGRDYDHFRVNAHPLRSYEVQLRNSNSVNDAPFLWRWIRSNTSTVEQGGVPSRFAVYTDPGAASPQSFIVDQNPAESTLAWIERYEPNRTWRITVGGLQGLGFQYQIALRETTLYCPRYNNSGSQLSVLIIQRVGTPTWLSDLSCRVEAYFYGEDRLQKGSVLADVTPRTATVLQAASIPGVAGTKGHVVIPHTCGYGGVQAKLVKLDPVTGFSFDTICRERTQ